MSLSLAGLSALKPTQSATAPSYSPEEDEKTVAPTSATGATATASRPTATTGGQVANGDAGSTAPAQPVTGSIDTLNPPRSTPAAGEPSIPIAPVASDLVESGRTAVSAAATATRGAATAPARLRDYFAEATAAAAKSARADVEAADQTKTVRAAAKLDEAGTGSAKPARRTAAEIVAESAYVSTVQSNNRSGVLRLLKA